MDMTGPVHDEAYADRTGRDVGYEGWRLRQHPARCVATRTLPAGGRIRIPLAVRRSVAYEGLWGGPLPDEPRAVLTGACIYSDCWRARVSAHRADARPPRPFVLGLRHDRARLLSYLNRGRRLEAVETPSSACIYQRRLFRWQAECISAWPSVEIVRYHLPVSIYHGFIGQLEASVGPRPRMHARLDRYAGLLRGRIRALLEPLVSELIFVDPGTASDGRPLTAAEADRRPYEERWDEPGLVALEDLAQLTIAASIATERGGGPPVQVAVLDLPHPLGTCGGEHCGVDIMPGEAEA